MPHAFGVLGIAILLQVAACQTDEPDPPDEVVDLRPPSQRPRVFYLKNGTLGKIRDSADPRSGLEAADADCTQIAVQRELGGTWRAWLSSSELDAIDRIADVSPWYRTDRETLLFGSHRELTRGPRDAIEPAQGEPLLFWSGTLPSGRRSDDTCHDWTVYNVPAIATVGRADAVGLAWIVREPLLCSNYLALLCIEQ